MINFAHGTIPMPGSAFKQLQVRTLVVVYNPMEQSAIGELFFFFTMGWA